MFNNDEMKRTNIAEFEKVSFEEYYKSRTGDALEPYDQDGVDSIRD